MAARVAAQLRAEEDVQVETIRGGFGEFSVFIDDDKVIDTSRFWYPTPHRVVQQVRALLAEQPG